MFDFAAGIVWQRIVASDVGVRSELSNKRDDFLLSTLRQLKQKLCGGFSENGAIVRLTHEPAILRSTSFNDTFFPESMSRIRREIIFFHSGRSCRSRIM
jgi:hypothetical protein